jgi:hypothetical protein
MAKTKKPQFGKLPPQYSFIINPYPDVRVSKCPFCEQKTGQRKIPLLIHVAPMHLIALNYTCRYCKACDLLIAHKHEIEHLLTKLFSQRNPEAIGNEYMIMGTVAKKAWIEGLRQSESTAEILSDISSFVECYQDLQVTRPGWYREDQEPPFMEPPVSQEWVKSKPGTHPNQDKGID